MYCASEREESDYILTIRGTKYNTGYFQRKVKTKCTILSYR